MKRKDSQELYQTGNCDKLKTRRQSDSYSILIMYCGFVFFFFECWMNIFCSSITKWCAHVKCWFWKLIYPLQQPFWQQGPVSWKTVFPGMGVGDGFSMILVHCIYCALYLYYYHISTTSNLQASDPRDWRCLYHCTGELSNSSITSMEGRAAALLFTQDVCISFSLSKGYWSLLW